MIPDIFCAFATLQIAKGISIGYVTVAMRKDEIRAFMKLGGVP